MIVSVAVYKPYAINKANSQLFLRVGLSIVLDHGASAAQNESILPKAPLSGNNVKPPE